MQERRADVDVAHEPGTVGERVDGGAARDALVPAPALARGDEAGEREPAERDATLPHAAEQLEGRAVAAAADAAGDGGVPGGRGPVGHFVEQVERGGGIPAAEVEGEEGVAVEGAERERMADGEAVDGAGEEGVVAEAGEAGARELRDGGVRVVGEQGESRWRWSALLRGGGSGYAAGGGGGGGEEGMRRRPVEAAAVDGRRPGAARKEREKQHPASRRRIRGLFGPSNN